METMKEVLPGTSKTIPKVEMSEREPKTENSLPQPSGVDRFKQQFAHLEEHHGKGERTAPRLRQHASLPRERVCAPIDDPVSQTNDFEKRTAASVGRTTLQSPPRFQAINVSESANKKVTTMQNGANKPNYSACSLMKSPSISASKCMEVKERDCEDEAIPEQNAEAAERLSQKVAALYA
ncbi:Mitogen-activated protein kinase 9 [Vitis vinifera]|uniref:Mitogen-activated protein kinase 9 n=1 Tax=Vitis vinifera TaxID=29760 RepID=A0A438JUU0_VITVI|nr:Mitogen-activated protein kinase 9 [Vitis vinifera]